MPKLCIATMSHDKDTKLTSVFLKMSPNLSWYSQGSLYRLRAAYNTLMAAMVVGPPKTNTSCFIQLVYLAKRR